MIKNTKHKPVILTVMIAFAVITADFLFIAIGKEFIIYSESYAAEKRQEKMASELLNEYDYQAGYDAYVISCFHERNRSGIICVVNQESDDILELHINFNQMNLHEPISSLTPELSKMFEMNTEELVREFCKEHEIDYERDCITNVGGDKLNELIAELQQITGTELWQRY